MCKNTENRASWYGIVHPSPMRSPKKQFLKAFVEHDVPIVRHHMIHRHRVLLVAALYALFLGCQSTKVYRYPAAEVSSYRDKRISALVLKNGDVQAFGDAGGMYVEFRRDTLRIQKIIGNDQDNRSVEYDLDRVLEIESGGLQPDGALTILTVLAAGTVALYFTVLLIFSGSHWN
jgi:hypothetical protein